MMPGCLPAVSAIGVCLLTCILWPCLGQTTASTARRSSSSNPKCQFLRQELRRLAQEREEVVQNSPFRSVTNLEQLAEAEGTIDSLAQYFADVEQRMSRERILRDRISYCDAQRSLASMDRLESIERLRARQVDDVRGRWRAIAGEPDTPAEAAVVARINQVFEEEGLNLQRAAAVDHGWDPEVRMGYPNLVQLIRDSQLDPETKDSLSTKIALIRFEEAGRLANILAGIDKDSSLNYAIKLRNILAQRETLMEQVRRDRAAAEQKAVKERWRNLMWTYGPLVFVGLGALVVAWVFLSYARAKVHAFRTGKKRVPYWGGLAELILWEPGETVVILQNKRLTPMGDPGGGMTSISAWRGQEYKGRITYKTRMSMWRSGPILTSDGLQVSLAFGIWWKIVDPGRHVSAIAADYHLGSEHRTDELTEAAEVWIERFAASTLREQVNMLPAERLISPYVQTYIQVANERSSEVPQFSDVLLTARAQLSEKTTAYGIQIERLEVQELILPPVYQEKLEAVRVAFLEPYQSKALTEAQVIALRGLASVIGPEKVGLIEILKHVDLSRATMNPFTGVVPVVQPILNTVTDSTLKGLDAPVAPAASLNPGEGEPGSEKGA
jgi:hypothetical protein